MRPELIALLHPVQVDDLIRVGRDYDGGYVVSARSIDAADLLIALGINDDWSFEQDFIARRRDAALIGVDGTVSAARMMNVVSGEAARSLGELMRGKTAAARANAGRARRAWRLRKSFGELFRGRRRVFFERMVADVEQYGSITWSGLSHEAQAIGVPIESARFVKMDIEGAEYRCLPALLKDSSSISGMVIEFHDCDLCGAELERLLSMILDQFAIVHVHGNNCSPPMLETQIPRAIEVSFMNRRFLSDVERTSRSERSYPLQGLDMPCDPQRPDPRLVFGSSNA